MMTLKAEREATEAAWRKLDVYKRNMSTTPRRVTSEHVSMSSMLRQSFPMPKSEVHAHKEVMIFVSCAGSVICNGNYYAPSSGTFSNHLGAVISLEKAIDGTLGWIIGAGEKSFTAQQRLLLRLLLLLLLHHHHHHH